MTDQQINPLKEETEALGRIAMTHDGRLLHRFLRRMVEAVCVSDVGGALPRHEGGRMFAATLMRHMAEGIESSGGRTSSSDDGEPILARTSSGARVASARDTRRVSLVAGDGFQPYDSDGNPVDPGRTT